MPDFPADLKDTAKSLPSFAPPDQESEAIPGKVMNGCHFFECTQSSCNAVACAGPVISITGPISTSKQNCTRATANESFPTQLERNDLRAGFKVMQR